MGLARFSQFRIAVPTFWPNTNINVCKKGQQEEHKCELLCNSVIVVLCTVMLMRS